MSKTRTCGKIGLLGALAMVGIVGFGGPAMAKETKVAYSWVQLLPGGKRGNLYQTMAVARLAIEKKKFDCEKDLALTLDGKDLAADTRENPGGSFKGITLCQVTLDSSQTQKAGTATVKVKGKTQKGLELPIPDLSGGLSLETLVSIGDTGCRDNNSQPDCTNGKGWPFEKLANRIVADNTGKTPVVLHTGDYRLSEPTSKDAWVRDKSKGWGGRKPEFFQPAAALLTQAYWLHMRGNHESCADDKETGEGWLFFFDFSATPQRMCDDITHKDEGGYLEPYALDAQPQGDAASMPIRLVFMDFVHRVREKQMLIGRIL